MKERKVVAEVSVVLLGTGSAGVSEYRRLSAFLKLTKRLFTG
jgi:hypothetical protein